MIAAAFNQKKRCLLSKRKGFSKMFIPFSTKGAEYFQDTDYMSMYYRVDCKLLFCDKKNIRYSYDLRKKLQSLLD